ncbi:uncharacterized protein DS421_14g466880 [Arachis hypogaea]|nr:uncharacterized protein DS421_14g466880 [Arachis hypogaea]
MEPRLTQPVFSKIGYLNDLYNPDRVMLILFLFFKNQNYIVLVSPYPRNLMNVMIKPKPSSLFSLIMSVVTLSLKLKLCHSQSYSHLLSPVSHFSLNLALCLSLGSLSLSVSSVAAFPAL